MSYELRTKSYELSVIAGGAKRRPAIPLKIFNFQL